MNKLLMGVMVALACPLLIPFLITEEEVLKSEMCRQAQGVCNRECEDCAWNEQRGEE